MTELPCSGTTLPTKAEFVQVYNDILMIPSQLKAYSVSTPDLDVEVQKQIDDIVKQIEDFAELQSSILSPYWQKGQIRNWQKEGREAWSELIDEFHIYIPAKMLEMISKVIPIGFSVSIMGISVDVLKILEKDEQESIKRQITSEVDKFYGMVPKGYQYYDGEFGVLCDEWKGKLTWDYFKNEIILFCTNTLHAAFGKLIDKFKTIWDALSLPSLPALLTFDVETWIRGQIDGFKAQAIQYKESLEQQAEQLNKDIETAVGDAKKDIQDQLDKLNTDIEDFSVGGFVQDQLEDISLFGMSLQDIIGGEINTNVKCPEEEIADLVRAARDWFAQWQKELINMWIKKIKSFLDAIGLGALLDFLTLTFCDVLGLIGIPTSFEITLPEIPTVPEVMSNGV